MSKTIGIVGLPNVGKSTLFNAITKQKILAANYPFATIDPNVGIVTVPDSRLMFLEKLYAPQRTISTTFEFTDIAGLVKGASLGEGLGNQFLSHIREVDAICEVVRCFEDSNIIHVENNIDPIRDITTIEVELMLADLEVVQNRIAKIGRKASLSNDSEAKKESELLEKIKLSLEKSVPVRKLELDETEQKIIKPYHLLTQKPIIYVANVSEKELGDETNIYVDQVKEYAAKENALVVTLSAQIEADLCDLEEKEKTELLMELGLGESGLDKLIKAAYHLLGLATYFTAGPDEVKAWTFLKGMKAPACAGIIHTDFEKGFIRAEIMSYTELEKLGSEKAVRDAGKMRLEGKDYEMQDGDICNFRFHV